MDDRAQPRFGPVTYAALFGGTAAGLVGVGAAHVLPSEWARQILAGAVTLGATLGMLLGAIVERRHQLVDRFIRKMRVRWRCPACSAEIESMQAQPRCPYCERALLKVTISPRSARDGPV
jgi:DNA-directed RNA polymerase subunit RPC12/RpoP